MTQRSGKQIFCGLLNVATLEFKNWTLRGGRRSPEIEVLRGCRSLNAYKALFNLGHICDMVINSTDLLQDRVV